MRTQKENFPSEQPQPKQSQSPTKFQSEFGPHPQAKGHPDFVFVTSSPPAVDESIAREPSIVPSAALRERMTLIAAQPYFAALSEADLEYLAVRMKEAKFSASEIMFLEGDPCLGLYIVREGEARIYKISPDGREQVLHYVKPGQSFNEVPVFDEGPTPANVVAMSACTCWIVPRSLIIDFMRTRPEMAMTIIRNIGRRLRHLVSLAADLSLRTVTYRLAKLLLDTASNDQLERVLTQQEMAAQLGTVREVVARSLKQLENCGYIRIERGRIVIVDRKALEDIA